MRRFESYAALIKTAEENRDFLVEAAQGPSGITVMAPHGGGIEPGTDSIARAIAGSNHGFYAFRGIRPKGNRFLGLASHHFDEPRALGLIRDTQTVVTLHGCRGTTPLVYIGGLDTDLKSRIADRFNHHGFEVKAHPPAALSGEHPENLCNRGLRGMGVQLELSMGLRIRLLGDRLLLGNDPNHAFRRFVSDVRQALNGS